MSDILSMTAVEARAALDKKAISAVELATTYIAAAEETASLNNYVAVTADHALSMAAQSDRRIAAGEAGILEGIPVGVKDLFCTAGVASTACSRILQGFTPTYESTVTANLWQAGGVMLGKLNCDEFAMGSGNETSAYGPAISPWQGSDGVDLVPGGSSGGSASAVAARSALMATGTDTGGSIRQPAAFCGVVGLKPTYGRCSRWGIVAFASSLDQAGPFSRTVADNALMMQAMASHDPKDSTSADEPLPDLSAALGAWHKGHADRGATRICHGWHGPGSCGAVGDRASMAARCRCRTGRHFLAAYEICASGLLHHRARRSVVESGAL
jgi:aspartyl-tRNA(Asn)/glutamyl-tRNA(Gln) amidotransferase subunit A